MKTESEALLEHPFFIVGPLRSGTTLLRLIMDHHSRINCFGEFETSVSQCVGNQWPAITDFHHFLKSDRQAQIYHFKVDPLLPYPELIYSFLEQRSHRKPSDIIGASVHSRIDMLPKLWPKAKFIHLLRDPRDVARSCIGMGWVGNVYEGSNYWLKVESHWDQLIKQIPQENAITVKYEDMVTAPEESISRLCQFLGLGFEERMLEIEATTSYTRPSAKFAEQWKRKLNQKEIEWVEYRCSPRMEARGYELVTRAPKPCLFQRLGIKLQNKAYRVTFNVKRYGLRLWALHGISKHFGFKKLNMRTRNEMNKILVKHLA